MMFLLSGQRRRPPLLWSAVAVIAVQLLFDVASCTGRHVPIASRGLLGHGPRGRGLTAEAVVVQSSADVRNAVASATGDNIELEVPMGVGIDFTNSDPLVVPVGKSVTINCAKDAAGHATSMITLDTGTTYFTLEENSTLAMNGCATHPFPVQPISPVSWRPVTSDEFQDGARLICTECDMEQICKTLNDTDLENLRTSILLLEPTFELVWEVQNDTAVYIEKFEMQAFLLEPERTARFLYTDSMWYCPIAPLAPTNIAMNSDELWDLLVKFQQIWADRVELVVKLNNTVYNVQELRIRETLLVSGVITLDDEWSSAAIPLQQSLRLQPPVAEVVEALGEVNERSDAAALATPESDLPVIDFARQVQVFEVPESLGVSDNSSEATAALSISSLHLVNLPVGSFITDENDFWYPWQQYTSMLWFAVPEYRSYNRQSGHIYADNVVVWVECGEVEVLHRMAQFSTKYPESKYNPPQAAGYDEVSKEHIVFSQVNRPGLNAHRFIVTCKGPHMDLLKPLDRSKEFAEIMAWYDTIEAEEEARRDGTLPPGDVSLLDGDSSSSGDSSSPTVVIVLSVLGALLLASLVVGGWLYYKRRSSSDASARDAHAAPSTKPSSKAPSSLSRAIATQRELDTSNDDTQLSGDRPRAGVVAMKTEEASGGRGEAPASSHGPALAAAAAAAASRATDAKATPANAEALVQDAVGERMSALPAPLLDRLFVEAALCSANDSTSLQATAAGILYAVQTVELVMDEMHRRRMLLMDRWVIQSKAQRRVGGQGLVQFVEDKDTGAALAVKLFLAPEVFVREADLYEQPHFRAHMAAVVHVEKNAAGTVQGPGGYKLPPFIVMERGKSLADWTDSRQVSIPSALQFVTSLQVLVSVVDLLQKLHTAGLVHRDLKPGNILWRESTSEWTLIDFGCTANIGSEEVVVFSLPYAPPEIITTLEAGQRTLRTTTAMDMWSLGVIMLELLTQQRLFPSSMSREQICAQLSGREALPWEEGSTRGSPVLPTLLKRVVMQCLSRQPSKRPSAHDLFTYTNQLFVANVDDTL